MTDNLQLFRPLSLRRTRRRWIKVGGGFLQSHQIGEAVVHNHFGKEFCFSALFVPNLGVTLISGQKLVKEFNLFGVMGYSSFYMVDNQVNPVLEYQSNNGVYQLHKVWSQPSLRQTDQSDPIECIMGLHAQFSLLAKEEEVVTRDIELYNLYYRRFLHLRSEKLRNLHKVTTLSKAIPIVNTDHPYEVCSLTKMKKRRGEATGRKKGILQLVSLDIYRPIPLLRLGFRYFLIIIDNYLRKK